MKNAAKPITAYVDAVEQLQSSVTTFRTARESLQEASESLGNITQMHGEVARSLGKMEERLLELLPENFQRTLVQQQESTAGLIRSFQSQFEIVEGATASTAASLLRLEQDAQSRETAFNERIKRDTNEVVQEFSRQSQLAATQMTRELRTSIDTLSKNVDRLVGQLQSEEFQASLTSVTGQLNRSAQESAKAAETLSSATNGFTALLADTTGSVHTVLTELTSAERAMPRWGRYLFGTQVALFLLILIGVFL